MKTYLETMFLHLPSTPEVAKAKSELWQIMEDKYEELRAEGKSENEAVGTVITEFGNLEELAPDLGIEQYVVKTEVGSYQQLSQSNERSTKNEDVTSAKEKDVPYINKTAAAIMSVYWSTVTCIYLLVSFLTSNWEITWIIWPVAAVIYKFLQILLKKEGDDL